MSDNILTVSGLGMRFGGIKALSDVSFDIKRHSITALIGPNGAGKTTVFNCLTGFYKATDGEIRLDTADGRSTRVGKIMGERFQAADFVNPVQFGSRLWYKMFGGTHLVNRAGLARTFQNIRLFKEMSVVENLLVAQHMQCNRNLITGILNTPGYRRAEEKALDTAFYWLEVVDLVDHANRLAGELSYGQQRRLEIARAMCTRPEIVCLDEPAAGLNPAETEALAGMIRPLARPAPHHRGADRARHGHGDEHLRPHRGTGPWPGHRPRPAGRYPQRSQGHRRLPRRRRRGGGMTTPILEFRNVDVFYGPIQALKGVSLTINEGETVSLIGANGAGKSTLLMSIFSQPQARNGQILYRGEDITRKNAHYVASNGIAQSPEGRHVFPDMSVEENLLMGTIPIGTRWVDEDMQRMFDLFPRLKERRNQRAMTMSGGEQQMLAIARALMSRPKLLLLDEPSLGLAPIVVKQIFQILRELAKSGMTIFLVEQNANHALRLSDRAYVMVTGEIRMTGSGQELLANPQVREAYLGGH
ncbi:ABC-type branched-subunit amino acid transport system ATPase component [Pseudomonas psychrotolerans]|nr:ABC-type branched-subunit amino acid transport system ATPase component [Pseudomonas psychrotolerans]